MTEVGEQMRGERRKRVSGERRLRCVFVLRERERERAPHEGYVRRERSRERETSTEQAKASHYEISI